MCTIVALLMWNGIEQKKRKYRNIEILLFMQNCQFQKYVYFTSPSLLFLRVKLN